jgi:hypothetical protein
MSLRVVRDIKLNAVSYPIAAQADGHEQLVRPGGMHMCRHKHRVCQSLLQLILFRGSPQRLVIGQNR